MGLTTNNPLTSTPPRKENPMTGGWA
jgi:hypothetical protein